MFNFIKIRNFNFLKKNSHTPTNIILIPTKKQNGITLIALIITILFSYDEKLKCSNSKGFLLATI